MDRLKPLFAMLVGGGVMGVVVAVVVPLVVIAVRDRATDPTPVSGFPTSTPVIQGVQDGQAPSPIPKEPTVEPTVELTVEPTVKPPPDGEQVFQSASPINCSVCHSLDGTDGLGPSLQGISSRAGDRVAGLSARDYIVQSIKDPVAYIVEGFTPVMPLNFSETLTAQQIEDVAAYLMTQ